MLVAFIALLATRKAASDRGISSELIGKAAPQVSGQTIQGGQFDIDRYRGVVDAYPGSWVVVNFFATWCVPCQQEHPQLVDFAKEHAGDQRVQVVSIAFDDQPSAVKAFFDRNGGDWPVLATDTGKMALDFGVTGVPETYVVDPYGRVVAKFEGVTQKGLDTTIDQLGGLQAAGSPR